MKEVELHKIDGSIAGLCQVDDEDNDWLNQFNWVLHPTGYAQACIRIFGIRYLYFIHRLVMCAKPGSEIDHIDRNRLNNQKSNLRFCTRSQNQHNRSKKEGASSVYVGVSYNNRNKNWRAQIKIEGKRKHLGYFSTELEAALAYDKAAIERDPMFHKLNFPPVSQH